MPRYRLLQSLPFLYLALLCLALVSCGGGGGSNDYVDEFADQTQGAGSGSGSGPGPGNGTGEEITFRTLFTGDVSAISTARNAVARDAAEYATLWAEHGHSAPAPAVDFTTETVVAVFIGTRAASGYGAEIVFVETQGSGCVVHYNATVPGSNCPPGLPVITQPYVFAAIEHRGDAITFSGGVRSVSCPMSVIPPSPR